MKHEITRVRHELRRRLLTVVSSTNITPHMRRIELTGDDLADFVSLGPDDHIKIFAPGDDAQAERRDYTPRRYDRERRLLTLDFALHEAGPATKWALGARAGDTLEIGGPRGSTIVPPDFDWWLLIGDETALPAIGRRIEELSDGVPAISIVAVTDHAETQRFETSAKHTPFWAFRSPDQADDPAALLAILRDVSLPAGDGFVWIAAEANVARAVKRYVTEQMGHPPEWMKASGYWVKGQADAHEKMER